MKENNQGYYYIEELTDIHFDNEINNNEKYKRLRELLEKITKELVKNEAISFSNLFSRLTFIVEKYKTGRKIHIFRVKANEVVYKNAIVSEEEYNTHIMYFILFIKKIFECQIPNELNDWLNIDEYKKPVEREHTEKLSELRAEVVKIEESFLICDYANNQSDEYIKVAINATNLNEEFSSVHSFWAHAQINLVNIEIDEQGIYYPRFIILEPDYLVDVSSIAECFQDYGATELNYLKSKFEEIPNSKHIRLGNFANSVIDKFATKKDNEIVEFINVLKDDFNQYPIEYASCSDIESPDDFKKFYDNAQLQFENIKNTIQNVFSTENVNIDITKATLEPTFINKRYGIQGRLDILQNASKNNGVSKIVELKSGGTPFPDDGKSIKSNHQTQLYLYYQLIGYINKLDFTEISKKTNGYILYSKVNENGLRYSEIYLKKVQEILNLRNEIVINENRLASDKEFVTNELLQGLTAENFIKFKINPKFEALIIPQIEVVKTSVNKLSNTEKKYFISYINFIAKEQYLAKLGSGQYDSANGLASLWLNDFIDKNEKFEILYDLEIETNNATTDIPTITFKRTNEKNKFVNFRVGDIVVLYPRDKDSNIATDNQVFKASINNISKTHVTLIFRYKQNNNFFFENYTKWAIEKDFMDTTFNSMYRNLYSFITSNQIKKNLLLGLEHPKPINSDYLDKEYLSEEQNKVLNKALSAQDYFLLNGPPGTGKTSIIIKELVKDIITNSNTNILLLAYTNRAVDEICEAVSNALVECDKQDLGFVRIGSELSCKEKYKQNLLLNLCKDLNNRNEIKQLITTKRIFIATVASVSSKMDLFKLTQFDRIIVDEASQILEPQIIGILVQTKRFILIGDHKQLPAIVLQDPITSKTNDKVLEDIGLANRKNSLFERLYKYCKNNHLDYAFDTLTYQGRMHEEIALFPNHSFYNSILKSAYKTPNLNDVSKEELSRQIADLDLKSKTKNTLEDLLSKKRLMFFPSKIEKENHYGKSNIYEANLVVKIVNEVIKLYEYNNKKFDTKKTIGIIATYRNQIAIIKQQLEEAGINDFENITVDTVERFQGSQRDIIILSFAVNNYYQLNGIVNLNDDGTVDRKLNVALTRAKEQLIIIGNDDILSSNLIYYKLIEFIKSKGGYVWDKIDDVLENRLIFNYFDKEETIEGKLFMPDKEFKSVFEEIIINPLKFDKRTINYPDNILGQSNDFIRNNVIEYGRTDFDKVFAYQTNLFSQEFSVKDKVILYCYYNMRKHYFSNLAVFESFEEFFKIEFIQTSNRVTFIDYGCGPLTAGLAFNQFAKKHIENFYFNYFGVDISNGMVDMAKTFSTTKLFNENSTFQFFQDFKDLKANVYDEIFRVSNVVILNFSYLFANLNPEQTIELANNINQLVEMYPLNKYIVIYQNPVNKYHNFVKFKKELKDINKTIVRNTETVSYKNSESSWYDASERFTYEIITN